MSEQESRRLKAIKNNEGIYTAVFAANNVKLTHNNEIYYSTVKVPPLNSNICTKSPFWKPDAIFDAVQENAKKSKWESWSIKDSFSCLDLTDRGFKKLFNAQWLYIDSKQFKPATQTQGTVFKKVETHDELEDWINIWGEKEQIYNSQMLSDPDMHFLIGYEGPTEKCAALLNRTDDVMGVSNFFPKNAMAEKWSDLLTFVYERFGPIDVVGYERKEVLEKLAPIGAVPVGDLIVWISLQSQ